MKSDFYKNCSFANFNHFISNLRPKLKQNIFFQGIQKIRPSRIIEAKYAIDSQGHCNSSSPLT